ncbi:hypothetical protein ACFL0X_02515 [Nanoarchaeota archaeon]
MEADIKATFIGLISIAISLFAIYFEENRIIILSPYPITLVGYFLFTYLNRIEKHEDKIKQLEESFKRIEDLTEIRAEIKNLKRSHKQ